MSTFDYQAVDQTGKKYKGVIAADTIKHARALLREKGWVPVHVQPARESIFHFSLHRAAKRKLSREELAILTRQFATLVAADLPLEEILKTVSEQIEQRRVKATVLEVRAKVLEGHSFSEGLVACGEAAFPNWYSSAVASGERSGFLAKVLENLADYVEKQHATQKKIQHALVYPALMISVSLFIVGFLLVKVMPNIVESLTQSNAELPGATKFLLGLSDFLRHYGIGLLIFIVALVGGLKRLLKVESVRKVAHQLVFKTFLTKRIVRSLNASRYLSTLGMLTEAGVPIVESMHAANALVTNMTIKSALARAGQQVKEGSSVHQALALTGFFPALTIHLIAGGESSGRLEEMLNRAGKHHDSEMNQLLEAILALFEPLLILVMGGIVLFIVVAILMPIFSLSEIAGV